MKHLGDITKIDGAKAEPVEVIIGGSPCQDLSVAGKRAGLDGARSGLFMEQIRIIKEMRENDKRAGRTGEFCRPRFMVWENVPGALSSNRGEDFRIVLEETAKIADPDVSIPRPPQKWTNAGCIMGNGYSIAWRILDAQYFGVPQRRRRIALVADFGGESAPEILFKRDSLQGHFEPSEEERKTAPADAERCADTAISFQERAGCAGGARESLSSPIEQEHCQQSIISECCGISGDKAGTLDASYYKGTGARSGKEREVVCYSTQACGDRDNPFQSYQEEIAYTVPANPMSDRGQAVCYSIENHPNDSRCRIDPNGKVQSLSSRMGTGGNNTPMCMTYGLDRASYNQGQNAKFDFSVEEEKIGAQTARGPGAIYHSVVRRLTPLECERLQSYPDYWTHIGDWTDSKGKKHKDSDSPKYKALGNSIAVCCWRFILRNINEYCTAHTMASLFDGIGGFPLIWEEMNGSKSCRWVSEIEEFPIAVTKIRFEQE